MKQRAKLAALILAALTAGAVPKGTPPLQFTVTTLAGGIVDPTTGAWGPDGRLYVGTTSGEIRAYQIDDDYNVQSTQIITTIESLSNNSILGITFNPFDDPVPPRIYVAHSQLRAGGDQCNNTVFPYSGQVSILTGPDFDVVEPLIGQLPVSDGSHGINGMDFDFNGDLLICVGSATNAGVPHCDLGLIPDSPFSGALLKALITRPDFDGSVSYVETDAGVANNNEVFGDIVDPVEGLHVFVYASGLRNPYDVVFTTEGRTYATDNGPNLNSGNASTSATTEGPEPSGPDELLLVEFDNYYGAANRNRGRYDERQNVYRDQFEPSIPGVFTQNLTTFPSSTDGLVEYRANTFNGAMRGDLLAQKHRGKTYRVALSADGTSVAGNTELSLPTELAALDVITGPGGAILGISHFRNSVELATPDDVGASGLLVYDISPWRAPGAGGHPFVIGGKGFGDLANTTVTVDAVQATIDSVSSTRIRGIIPSSVALPPFGLVDVVVTVNGVSRNLPGAFRYLEPPTIDSEFPTVPTGVVATAVSSTQIDVHWNPAADDFAVRGYRILRDGVVAQTTQTRTTSYSDTGLDPETTYSYAVTALDYSWNESAPSSPAAQAATPVAETDSPSVPTGVVATAVSSTQINIMWEPSTDNIGVAGYRVFRDGVSVGTTEDTSYSDTGLASSAQYAYTVEAFDAVGNNSDRSSPPAVATTFLAEPDLIAAFGFEEESGDIARDISGNGHDGTLLGGVVRNPNGYFGEALEFNGSSASVPLDSFDVVGTGLTAMAWFNADDFGTHDARIITKTTTSSAQDHYWMLSTINSGGMRLRGRIKTDDGLTTTLVASAGPALTAGEWFHAAVTFDESTIRLYRNGDEVGNVLKSGALATNASVPVQIGANPNGQNHFDGRIDEVRVFKRALSEVEIELSMTTPVGSSLVDYIPPTVPQAVVATAVSAQEINVTWDASVDNVDVGGYRVFRDSAWLTTVATTSYSDTGLDSATTHGYTIEAFDAANNGSGQSSPPAQATTCGLEVTTLLLEKPSATTVLSWISTPSTPEYAAYSGRHADLSDLSCLGVTEDTSMSDNTPTFPGELTVYLVTGLSCNGEGSLGSGTAGPRPSPPDCP